MDDEAEEYEVQSEQAFVPAAAVGEDDDEEMSLGNEDINWKKVLLLTGKPGTGKTHSLKQAIYEAIDQERNVLVATPTGFLASMYSAAFSDDVETETVHAAFKYPVSTDTSPEVNWELMRYDMIVLDEVSMISKFMMQHVLSTGASSSQIKPLTGK